MEKKFISKIAKIDNKIYIKNYTEIDCEETDPNIIIQQLSDYEKGIDLIIEEYMS